MSANAERSKRCRARQRRGVAVLRVPTRYYPLVGMLLDSGRLTEAEALDRALVEAALGRFVDDAVTRWKSD